MTTVWYCPQTETPAEAEAGDFVVAPLEDGYRVGEVHGAEAEWIGELRVEALPERARAALGGDEPRRLADESLVQALRNVVTAERLRGA